MSTSAFGVLHPLAKAAGPPARKSPHRGEEAAVVGGTAVAANEARALNNIHRHRSEGAPLSAHPHQGRVHDIPGVSDAPVGARFSQKTHPEGVYNISTDSLIRARNRPAPRLGQDQLRESIRRKGMDRPVHMKVWQDGTARIWDGHHRSARAAEVGLKKIPVSVTHVQGSYPKPKSLTEGVEALRRTRYQHSLLQSATHVIKRAPGDLMSTSAFGVEHEVSKGLITAATESLPHLGNAVKSFVHGEAGVGAHVDKFVGAFRGGLPGAKPKPMPGAGKVPGAPKAPKMPGAKPMPGPPKAPGLGARAGGFVKQNKAPLAVGAGGGAAVGIGISGRKRS